MNGDAPTVLPADVAVTTAYDPDRDTDIRARQVAEDLGCAFADRNGEPLERIRADTDRDCLIVVTSREVRLVTPDRVLWWHPNMAAARIEAMLRGERDRFVDYAGLRTGDRVFDATCGLGADAIVAAHAVGPTGHVTACERSSVLAALVRHGSAIYRHRTGEVEAAMRRVTFVEGGAMVRLRDEAAGARDVVYLDPMFDETLGASSGIDLVRLLGSHEEVSRELVDEAARVAGRCVVMKDRVPGRRLAAFGFGDVSRRGKVWYGRIDV